MELKNFVQVYDEILPLKKLSNLLRYINTVNFHKAGLGSERKIDFNIRMTYTKELNNLNNSMTEVHWHNLLLHFFRNNLSQYTKNTKTIDFNWERITDISVLKYEEGGFYDWHTDHFASIPRTMSCILLLNNDYEGGNICFRNPDGSGEMEIEVKPNRMIIWPSNFLYPHTVKPVTKGIRYSVVAWAL
tara:strand:- start:1288 stop:1851 length:564 start_codon:yes stop_codon:yes gene_type:complete